MINGHLTITQLQQKREILFLQSASLFLTLEIPKDSFSPSLSFQYFLFNTNALSFALVTNTGSLTLIQPLNRAQTVFFFYEFLSSVFTNSLDLAYIDRLGWVWESQGGGLT